MDDEQNLDWWIGGEDNRITFNKSFRGDHLRDWTVKGIDGIWNTITNFVGYLEDEGFGIQKEKDLDEFKEILVSTGARVDIVLLECRCAVMYVSGPCGVRAARFFVFSSEENTIEIFVYGEDGVSKTADGYSVTPYEIFGKKGLHDLGEWIMNGGALDIEV